MSGTYISSTIKKVNPFLLFFLLCLVLYLPASFIRAPLPPDEVRNIHVAQSIQSPGDYLLPKYLGEPYYEKPPLYFWLLKLFLAFPLVNFLVLPALFNICAAAGILSLNYLFFKKQQQTRLGLYSSFFLATTIIFFGMSFILRMDILFLFFIFAAVFFFWISLKEGKPKCLLAAAAFTFLAVFTKGALGIVFPLLVELAIATFLRNKKVFVNAVFVNLLAALMVFIWLFSFSNYAPDYFSKMFFDQTLARTAGSAQHVSLRLRPFFYYFPFLFLFLLPWTFLGAGYFLTFKRIKKDLWEKVYLVWFLAGFLILSLLRSKMEMYLLLLTIPFCALAAKFFLAGRESLKRKILYVTAGFFVFIWAGGFIYAMVCAEPIPVVAFGVLAAHLCGFIFILRQPAFVQLRNFFLGWVLFLQVINLGALPMIADHSELKRMADAVKKLEVKFNKIYVKDKQQLQLPAYQGINKPVVYWASESCVPDKNIIFVGDYPRYENTCGYKKVLQIGENRFLYKEQ